MTPDVSSSKAAGRALVAVNPVAFECAYPLAECVPRLADALPKGRVTADAVDLEWKAVRFSGRWVPAGNGARLEGTMSSSSNGIALTVFFLVVAVFGALGAKYGADANWQGAAMWFFAVPALLVTVGLPLLVSGLGSARVAAEVELVRLIGTAIGEREKYATQWRRWREE